MHLVLDEALQNLEHLWVQLLVGGSKGLQSGWPGAGLRHLWQQLRSVKTTVPEAAC